MKPHISYGNGNPVFEKGGVSQRCWWAKLGVRSMCGLLKYSDFIWLECSNVMFSIQWKYNESGWIPNKRILKEEQTIQAIIIRRLVCTSKHLFFLCKYLYRFIGRFKFNFWINMWSLKRRNDKLNYNIFRMKKGD